MKIDRKIPKMWASVGKIVGKKCTCLITEYIGNPRNNRPRVSFCKCRGKYCMKFHNDIFSEEKSKKQITYFLSVQECKPSSAVSSCDTFGLVCHSISE